MAGPRILRYSLLAPLLLLAALSAWQQFALRKAQAERATVAGSPIDVGFAQSMSRHHQQAITMAKFMLDGRPTRLSLMAQTIADTQIAELGQMYGWLRLWNQPIASPTRGMDWMLLGSEPPDAELSKYLLDCSRSPTGMTGLATPEELNRLRQLGGLERDRHFLRLMLAHHAGAIPMARFAADNARVPAVRELAARVVMDQSREIDLLRRMLAAAEQAR
jgi:uncharacterized protein (DUF305 family)